MAVRFRELRNRSLLLIGAPFEDWIVRFFFRVARQGRLSELLDTNTNYLADPSTRLGDSKQRLTADAGFQAYGRKQCATT